MIILKKKWTIIVGIASILHIMLGITYSTHLPWGGDEWYTWSGTSIMAFPYTVAVYIARLLFGEVNVGNYLLYRQIGLLCVLAAIGYLYMKWRKTSEVKEKRYITVAVVYLLVSSFVLFQEQLFRYYGFYLLCSFVVFHLLYKNICASRYNRRLTYTLLAISPFLHMFLFWQLLLYNIANEWLRSRGRTRVVLSVMITSALLGLVIYWQNLMIGILPLLFSGMHASGVELRGWSIGLLIKPIYAVFQFFFGTELTPTENLFVIVLLILLFLLLTLKLYSIFRRDRRVFGFLLMGGLVPFISMYWLLEPLTLPGSTQFESKHAIFVLPFILFMISWEFVVVPSWSRLILLLPLAAVLYGTAFDLSIPRADWKAIAAEGRTCILGGGKVIVDGRADQTLRFYLNDPLLSAKIISLQQKLERKSLTAGNGPILLVLNDWKSYQELSVAQNWNSGYSSAERVHKLAALLEQLKNAGAQCIWSYGVYPTYVYNYRLNNTLLARSFALQPPEIMYRDLVLPVRNGDWTVSGFLVLQCGDSLNISSLNTKERLLYTIQCRRSLPAGTQIGVLNAGTKSTPLLLDEPVGDAFMNQYSRRLMGSSLWYSWRKRPIVTSSLAYPGSIAPSKGQIHKLSISDSDSYIILDHPDIRLLVFGNCIR